MEIHKTVLHIFWRDKHKFIKNMIFSFINACYSQMKMIKFN